MFFTMDNYIRHEGIVTAIKNGTVSVRIERGSACASCHANGACTLLDKQRQLVEVVQPAGLLLAVGDEVLILEKKSLGMWAVFFAYVLPLFIVLLMLITLLLMNKSDIFAGVLSLLTLVPYYSLFFLLRGRLKNRFVFTLSKRAGQDDR
jgi:sigma-E factor negative regulatory protein RseC